jgi:hypothetical protein
MTKTADSVRKALGNKKGKLHTHSIKYSRADNGGLHAHVERHTAAGHHHDEHHVLNGPDEAAEHLQEHMGDQPNAGEGTPPEVAPEMQDAAAGGGGGAPGAGAGPAAMPGAGM